MNCAFTVIMVVVVRTIAIRFKLRLARPWLFGFHILFLQSFEMFPWYDLRVNKQETGEMLPLSQKWYWKKCDFVINNTGAALEPLYSSSWPVNLRRVLTAYGLYKRGSGLLEIMLPLFVNLSCWSMSWIRIVKGSSTVTDRNLLGQLWTKKN